MRGFGPGGEIRYQLACLFDHGLNIGWHMRNDVVEKGFVSCEPSRCRREILGSSMRWSIVFTGLLEVGDILALSPTFAVTVMTARACMQTATARGPFAVAFCLALSSKWSGDCDMDDEIC
jgi:hypothetical protein